MTPAAGRRQAAFRFYLLHLGGALLLAAATLVAIEAGGFDWRLSDLFFDPALRRFPLREHWFLEGAVHAGFRNAVVVLSLGVLAAWIASFRVRGLKRFRRTLMFIFLSMLLSSSAVSMLKSVSGKHCPYDLLEYGGNAPYTALLEPLPAGIKPGKCWPGGHASSGFCLFGFYFAASWLGRRRLAMVALTAALLLGFGAGTGRVMQGAHFLSHNVWSALVCWLVTLALYEVLLRRRELPKGD